MEIFEWSVPCGLKMSPLFRVTVIYGNFVLHFPFVSKDNSKGSNNGTMYDFHNSTDTLKFWTEKRAIDQTFLFSIWFWWNLVKLYLPMCTTISLSFIKIGGKKKRFINRLFFCSEFQSVSRIVNIVHSAMMMMLFLFV